MYIHVLNPDLDGLNHALPLKKEYGVLLSSAYSLYTSSICTEVSVMDSVPSIVL